MWLSGVESADFVRGVGGQPGSLVEVHLFCRAGGSEQHLRMLAHIRRAEGRNLGVEFVWPMPDLVRVVLDSDASEASVGAKPLKAGARNTLWQVCRARSQEFLGDLLEQFHEQVLDEIQRRQETAASFDEMNRLRDARVHLVETRGALEQDFGRHWAHQFGRLATPDARTTGERPVLEVVDKHQFEEWLELQMIATAATERQQRSLFLMNQYLSQLARREVDDRNNPIAPPTLCLALQYALHRRAFPEYLRPMLFEAFEKVLEQLWDGFVLSLNNEFETNGLRAIPPEKMRLNWDAGATRDLQHGDALGPGAGRDPQPVPAKPAAKTAAADGAVLSLMELLRSGGAGPHPGASLRPGPESLALLDQLAGKKLAIRQALRDGGQDMQSVLTSMTEAAPELQGRAAEGLRRLADLVDQIFAPLTRSSKLQPELLSLIRQLKLPVLQGVAATPDFLDRADHPGRRVLNYIVELCSADRVSSRHLEKTLSEVVDQIFQVDKPDAAFLKGIGDRLEVLIERQERAFRRNAERVARTCEGQQRLEQARRAIHRRINALLAGTRVPLVLIDLLASGWEQLMVLALLKEGGESAQLAEMFATLDQLNAWLGADTRREDLAFERELEAPALLEEVERQLKTTGEPGRYGPVLRQLRLLLQEEAEPEYVWLASYPLNDKPTEITGPVVAESRWLQRTRNLSVGDWVSQRLADGAEQRMQLVWMGEDAYKFVFLTTEGLHEVEMARSEMVDAFARGQLQQVDSGQVPFVDQSLYEIVQGIYRKMLFQATHDPLTGAMQRHEVEKQVTEAIMRARLRGETSALMVFDIDQFRLVNSTHGTAAGDAMLKECAALLARCLDDAGREKRVGRLGGNEFAVLLVPSELDLALDLAEQVRRRFQDQRFESDGRNFHAALSGGLVAITADSEDAGRAINQVSLACSAAKKAGGNRVRPYREDDVDQARAQAVLSWVARIDRALEQDELSLRVQRILSLSDPAQEHFEVLLGMDARDSSLSPQSFIEAAEKYNRATAVDQWVVDRTLAWMAANPERLAAISMLSVNLSGHSLSDDRFLAYLEELVRKGGVATDKLCFEVTETAAVSNLHYTADFMREMKALGCRFALDDFGTGFSSYAYLQHLPVDYLKIDGVFVRDLSENLTHYALVRSINDVAHFLGMQTIAEFVDGGETLEALREIRVDFAQGFGIEKPRPLTGV